MSPVYAIDRFYLGFALLITIGYQLLGFAIAWTFKFDKITDFTGGMSFVLMASIISRLFSFQDLISSFLASLLSLLKEGRVISLTLALLTLLIGNTFHARNIGWWLCVYISGLLNMTLVASVFVMIWAVRIAGKCQVCCPVLSGWWNQFTTIGFLLFRVVKRGSDSRFDEIRSNFLKFLGLLLA